ncbi:uncharacterized protein LOC112689564, partial [Sipha flava]|uniref:Uncharacterized protein LOC112689564 n=1 Tax=Sipha flava TaxID=143950 RepID=A0A8B8G940_9HEMI
MKGFFSLVCAFSLCACALATETASKPTEKSVAATDDKAQNKRSLFDIGYGYGSGYGFGHELSGHDFQHGHEQQVLSKTIIKEVAQP